MLKARILLGIVMVVSMVGFNLIYETAWANDSKAIAYFVDGLLYASACIAMAISFFSLNEKGEIPIGSMPYRYVGWMRNGKVPKEIRLCPAFWWIVGNLVLLSVFIGAITITIGVVLPDIIIEIAHNPIGFCASVAKCGVVLAGVFSLLFGVKKVYDWFGVKESIPATIVTAIAGPVLALLVLAIRDYSALHAVTILYAFGAVLLGISKAVVTVFAIAGAGCVIVVLFCRGASKLSPMVGSSFIGQLTSTAFNKLCPVILIEQKNPTDTDTNNTY